MTTYPLPTLACTVDATGISAPVFSDVLLSFQASYRGIFGSDTYLDPDSQDGQLLAIIATAINDANAAAIAVYNDFSPTTAVGVGLSSVVKVNGIARHVPSNSTAVVTIVGQAGSTILNGIVGDDQNLGTKWTLPSAVVIPTGGSLDATVTCTTAGDVAAAPGTLSVILTPTLGWQTATNAASAAPGEAIEIDSQLRARQSLSTQQAAQTVIDGMVGAVLNLPGVTAATPFENDTGSTDVNGLPAHSFTIVVEGGDVQAIVNVIGLKKSPGSQTFGNTSGTYVDSFGNTNTIFYTVPTSKRILVSIALKALVGYTDSIGTQIQVSVAAAINSLIFGSDVLITRLYVPAQLYGPFGQPNAPTDPFAFEITSILASISPASPGSTDLIINYDQFATCAAADVTLTVS